MTVSYRLSEIAAQLGGRVMGDTEVRISRIATRETAQPTQISFLTNSKYRIKLATTRAGAVILAGEDADATGLPRIISDNAYAYFAKVSALPNPLATVVSGVQPIWTNWRSASRHWNSNLNH
jgi:UDP-3-O-[3-hydroxymyristoyl] glucosamine N-acyltransferase